MSEHHHHHRREDDEDLAYGHDYASGRGYGGQRYDDGNQGYSEQQYDQGNRGYGSQEYDEGTRGYGDQQYGQGQGGDRGIIGDTFKKFKSKYDQYSSQQRPPGQDYGYGSSSTVNFQNYGGGGSYGGTSGGIQQQSYNTPQPGQPAYPGGPPQQRPGQKPGFADQILGGLIGSVTSIGHDVENIIGGSHGSRPPPPLGGYQQGLQSNLQTGGPTGSTRNRFESTFYGPKQGNDVKWFVDGCSYMWAVSHALESARQTIWILDWWLSPELYLRRPPARNEEWRIDKILLRAANRGVKVNIIVYKEVTQALTLSSAHTKHALEALSPNIGVFRHPDHLPDAQTAHSSILSSLQGLKLDAAGASKLGADALKGLYGITDDVILYWAHHEKLCLIDGKIAFMGGLDLCYGRWDTNQHPIADAHPSDLNKIVFPGQDFNNARVMDFSDVDHPFQNKLDRTKSSRMGWSDISICLRGPCVGDLIHHFVDRWNFIYDEKYNVRQDKRYQRLPDYPEHRRDEGPQTIDSQQGTQPPVQQTGAFPPPPGQSGNTGYQPPAWQSTSRPSTSGVAAIGGAALGGAAAYGAQGSSTQPGYNQQGSQQTFPPPPPGPPPVNQGPYGQPQTQGYQSTPVGQQQSQSQGQYGQSSLPGYQSTPGGEQQPQSQGQYGTSRPQSQYPGPAVPQSQQPGYPRPPVSPGPQSQYSGGAQRPITPQPSYGATQSQQSYTPSPQQGQGQSQPPYSGGQYQTSYSQRPVSPQPGPSSSQYQPSYPPPPVSPQPGQQRPDYSQSTQSPAPGQSQYLGQPQGQGQYGGPSQQGYSSRPHTPASSEAHTASQQYAAYTGSNTADTQGPIELGSTTSPQYKPYDGQPTARGLEGSGEYESGHSGEHGYEDPYDRRREEHGRGGERGLGDSYGQDRYGYDQGGERAFGGRKPGGGESRFDRYKDEALRKVEGKKILGQDLGKYGQMIDNKLEGRPARAGLPGSSGGGISAQLVRSCTKWSNGTPTEHSVQNAYIELIRNSRHFIYIENQFFITATGDHQRPVKNMIGAALVERIIRASRERTPFKIIVNIPSVPAFAGDLVADASLGTRAIMEYQYNSICRGGNSIMEEVAKAGVNPMDYIRFYNLRNYDRINVTPAMQQAQQQSGVGYDDARRQYEAQLGSGYGGYGETAAPISAPGQPLPYGGQTGQPPYGQQPLYGAQPGQGQTRAGPGDQQPGQAGYQPPGQQYGQQGGYNPSQPGAYGTAQQGGYQPPPQPSTYQPQSQSGAYSSSQQGGYQPPGQQGSYQATGQTSGYGPQQVPAGQGYQQYQHAAQKAEHVKADDWDTVSTCYMLNGTDIRNVPWSGSPEAELDAFVSEELYIHTKVMIVDDQTVICGSANLNDRSMLGTHDSEIALVIQDSKPIQSTMAGQPWQANRFAASLRRQLFRKHLGLLKPQDMESPNDNFMPINVAPNTYDWGTPEDNIVADPLSDAFQSLWNSRARTNTEVFRKAFRAVPDDNIKSWAEYKEFYEYYFKLADDQAVGKDESRKHSRVEYGHVVRADFPGGARELKELLSRVKGTLVEMPLCFLQNEDIAKEGLSFNALTAEIYT